MKRPFFKPISVNAGSSLPLIIAVRNITKFLDEWYWTWQINTTSSNLANKVYKTDDITSDDTEVFNLNVGSTDILPNNRITRSFGADFIATGFSMTYKVGVDDYTAYYYYYSLDGTSWVNIAGSGGKDQGDVIYDIMRVSATQILCIQYQDIVSPYIYAIHENISTTTTTFDNNGPVPDDPNAYYGGYYDGSKYKFLIYKGSAFEEWSISLDAAFTWTLEQTIASFIAPSTFNVNNQMYYKSSVVWFRFDNEHLDWYDFINESWTTYTASNISTSNAPIWDHDYLGNLIIRGFIWDNSIWLITDKGVLKKIQVLEPRDYKKVYLTNTNANLTGVIQFKNQNGITDLSAFTDSSGTGCTVSIKPLIAGHKQVLELDDQGVGRADLSYPIGQQTSGTIEFFICSDNIDAKKVNFQVNDISQTIILLYLESGNIYYYGAAGATDIGDYVALQQIHVRIDFDCATDTQDIYINNIPVVTGGDFYASRTATDLRTVYLRTDASDTGYKGYFDSIKFSWDGGVTGSNKKIYAYCGYGSEIGDVWFSTGDSEVSLFQLGFQSYLEGTYKALAIHEIYKAPLCSLIRTTEPFENEWIDLYTDAEQLFYGGKVKDNNNDNRFYWEYIMKSWQDEFTSDNKINEQIIQSNYRDLWIFILGKYSKYLFEGPGTNVNVNTFTESQIDGSDPSGDWANADGASCESTYQTKVAFLNGFMYDVLQQEDNNVAARCRVVHNVSNTTILSGWFGTDTVTADTLLQIEEGASRIGLFRITGGYIAWYDGATTHNLQVAVNNTKYHFCLVFNASDDDVDIYINGVFNSTQNLENNITTAITQIEFLSSTSIGGGTFGWFSNIYKGNVLFEALHTYSSITPLLTTKYNFNLKNLTLPGLMLLTAEETGFITSVRPNGQVYIDQYAPSGNTINADSSPNGITYMERMRPRNEKFSLITLWGGHIEGKQIFAIGFGEPNFGTYEAWYPTINGQDPDDIYYDDDGNPKSHRLDGMVTTALINRNVSLKKQTVGKRGDGLYYPGTSFTYNNSHFDINNETWLCWRKVSYNGITNDCRPEIADSVLSPTKSDGADERERQVDTAINTNAENITNVSENVTSLEENANSSSGQGLTPANGMVDSDKNYGANKNVKNFDTNLTGWITTAFSNANSSLGYNAELFDNKHVLKGTAGDTSEYLYRSITFSSAGFFSCRFRVEVADKDRIFYITQGGSTAAGFRLASGGNWMVWRNAAWVTLRPFVQDVAIDTWYHIVGYYDGSNVKYWINTILVYEKTTTDSLTPDQLRIFSSENNDGNFWYCCTTYYGTSFHDAMSSFYDGSWNPKQLITQKITGAIRSREVLTAYFEENVRNLDESLWGLFTAISLADTLDSGTPINVSVGCHRILFVINAGSDVSGTITITGTTRDRTDTTISTPADTEDIVIDSLSTDNSSSDAQGNTIHEYDNVFMSDKWFEGSISITTTDLTITDIDVYAILYHQFDSFHTVKLISYDFTGKCTNTAAWYYSYLYLIQCVNPNKKYNINNIAIHDITVGVSLANEGYRRRKILNTVIDGNAGHGVWAELFFGPAAATYWNDISIYLSALLDGEDPKIE
jgi:hypothetical protein